MIAENVVINGNQKLNSALKKSSRKGEFYYISDKNYENYFIAPENRKLDFDSIPKQFNKPYNHVSIRKEDYKKSINLSQKSSSIKKTTRGKNDRAKSIISNNFKEISISSHKISSNKDSSILTCSRPISKDFKKADSKKM